MLRRILFWLHWTAGIVAGSIIALLCVTGAAIAFEQELLAWFEHPERYAPPPGPERKALPMDELVRLFRSEHPDWRLSSLAISAEPGATVTFSQDRTRSRRVNPYTGQTHEPSGTWLRSSLQTLTAWHRWLGREGEGRAVGKAITGACNVACLFLAASGFLLWWPNQWTPSRLRGIFWFRRGLRGRARDWNWHNVIGLWSAPVLLVLTLSGMVISYRWASDLVLRIGGKPPLSRAAGRGSSDPPASHASAPVPEIAYEALLHSIKSEVPDWSQITLRWPGPPQMSEGKVSTPTATATLRTRNGRPRFASTQLTLDAATGRILRCETYADYAPGRKVRTWLRFLHTGEAFGLLGKGIATLGSIGGALLAWTGISLAVRRALLWRRGAGPG